jgi:membrane protein implicated in regulation of membrane protease activity
MGQLPGHYPSLTAQVPAPKQPFAACGKLTPMDSPDPIKARLWILGFRILSLGALVMGALVAVVGIFVAVVSVLPKTLQSPGLTFSYGVLFIVVGATFVLIGIRGFQMRTRHDLDADISKTAGDRDRLERWINR